MKKLFKLVLKVLTESKKSDIFWCSGRNTEYLTSNPKDSISYNDRHYMNNAVYSETDSVFNFKFKFKDGEPDVTVKLSYFKPTQIKTEKVKTGWFWNRKTTRGRVSVLKSHPIYKIYAGELSYETSLEEAILLHEEYVNLIKRDTDSKIILQEKRIDNRLKGKIELNTTIV